MSETPDVPVIEVSETAWGEIAPAAARIHVVLGADKLFSGAAALKKAEELRLLCAALESSGVPATRVALEGVSLDVSTGVFTRSSSVTYRVRVHLVDLDLLASALDAIAGAKKATLSHIEWDYDSATGEAEELLARCATRAAAKAKALASALGVSMEGLRCAREERLDGESTSPQPLFGAPAMARARTGSIGSELAGLDLAPKKRVGVRVRLEYAIGEPVAAASRGAAAR
jgi:uncharacterized protein YggE